MSGTFAPLTLVAVDGRADAAGTALGLVWSLEQMPGASALLCSPQRPAELPASIRHVPVAPLDYQGYSWFVLYALGPLVQTEFALIVQQDGWVLDAANWQDAFYACDYLGAPIHLARVLQAGREQWMRGFEWTEAALPDGARILPVLNGGFSLRSQRMLRALHTYRDRVRVTIDPPDRLWRAGEDQPLALHWMHDPLNEDVQLTAVLRPALEACGLRYPTLELARDFAIEYAAPALHAGMDVRRLFGQHAPLRKLVSLRPPTVRYACTRAQALRIHGEAAMVALLEGRGYRVGFADEGGAAFTG